MKVGDKVVAITGAGGGIGSALARRFAAEGARGVVLADLDLEAVSALAQEIGEPAAAVACDAADPAQVAELIATTESNFGPIDLFCANAGVMMATDIETTEDEWDLAFDVNVRAHAIATRQLIPRWLDRGGGYLLTTASAAGLLGQIGSLPYSVTKHAAVGLAEWISITYGDRGVRVSCLCPMGVDTTMLRSGLDATDHDAALAAATVVASGAVLRPDQVADVVVRGLEEESFLILPHPEVLEFLARKIDDYDSWLSGMRRLRRTVPRQP